MALVLTFNRAPGQGRIAGVWAPALAVGGHVLLAATIITLSGERVPTLPATARPVAVRFVAPVPARPAPELPAPAIVPPAQHAAPAVVAPKPARRPATAVPVAAPTAAPPTPLAAPVEAAVAPSAAAVEPSDAPAPAPVRSEPAPMVPARFDAAYLNNPKPIYPPSARRRGETGTVTLRVLVSEDGTAAQVELKGSSGSSSLDQAAQDAVARWRFVPARQGDAAVRSWVLVPVSFSLN